MITEQPLTIWSITLPTLAVPPVGQGWLVGPTLKLYGEINEVVAVFISFRFVNPTNSLTHFSTLNAKLIVYIAKE